MNRTTLKPQAVLLSILLACVGTIQAAAAPMTLGWVERVGVINTGLVMNAKIDTGADNSSINASSIDYVTRDGSTWVRFKIQDQNGTGIALERPLVRIGQIKRKEGGYLERPVVTLDLCVAGQMVNAEVNLADRDHFKYPMLVGRSLMARRFLVDPERTYITQPACAAS